MELRHLRYFTQATARGARAAQDIEGALCIGIGSAAGRPLIPRIVCACRAAWPGIDLRFREGNAAELYEAHSCAYR